MARFPEVRDIRLSRPPLREVICQVRFPVVLRIANEQPVQFQERIRMQFPELEVEHGFQVEIPPPLAEMPIPQVQPRIYRFRTEDGQTVVSLAAGFLAVSTTDYRHWADYCAPLRMALNALMEIYQPGHAGRVGLRYVNRLTCSNTGADCTSELLEIVRPSLTELVRDPCWDEPPASATQTLLPINLHDRLMLRSSYEHENTPAFVLDFDCFTEERMPLQDVLPRVEEYHDLIYRAFRWCIRSGMLERFVPGTNGEE